MGEQVNSSISLYSKENFGILSKNIDGDNESLSVLARNEDKNHFVNFSKFLREKKEELERSKIFSKEKNSDLDFSKIDSKDKEEVIKCRTNFFEGKFLPFLKNPKSKDKVDLDEAKDIDSNNNWDDCFDNKPKSKEYHDLWLRLSKAEAKNILEKSGKKSNNYRNSDSDYGSQVPSEKDRYKNAKRKIEKFKELDLGGESFSVLESEDYSSPDFLTELGEQFGEINSLGKDSNLKKFLDANLRGLCTNFANLEEDLNGEDVSLDGLQDKLKSDDDIEGSLKKLVNLKKATFKYMFDAAMLDINSCNNKIELSGGFDEQEYDADADENENSPDNKKYLGFLVNMLSKLEEQLEKIDINLGGAEQDKEEEETDEKNNQKENVSNENAQKKIFYDPYWYINNIEDVSKELKNPMIKSYADQCRSYYIERAKLSIMYEHIDKIDINKFIDSNLIFTETNFLDDSDKETVRKLIRKKSNQNSNNKNKEYEDELKKIKDKYISRLSNQISYFKVEIGKEFSKYEKEIEDNIESGKKECEEANEKKNIEQRKIFELLTKGKEFESNNNKDKFENMLIPSDTEYFKATGNKVINIKFLPAIIKYKAMENMMMNGSELGRWKLPMPFVGGIKAKLQKIERKFPTEISKIDKSLSKYFNSNSNLFKSIFSAEEDKKKLDEAKQKEEEDKKNAEKGKKKAEEIKKSREEIYKNADPRLKSILAARMNSKFKKVEIKTPEERVKESKNKFKNEEENKKKAEEEKAKRENEEKEKKAMEEEKIRQAEERSTPEKFLEYLGVKSINELKIKYIDNKKGDKDAEVYKNAFEEFEKRYKELVQQVSDKAGENLKKALEEVGPPRKTIKDFFEPKDSWQIDCLLTMEKRVGYDEYVKITSDDKPNAQRYLKFLCLKNINELDKAYENFKSESNHEDYKKNIEYYKQEYEQVKEKSLYL